MAKACPNIKSKEWLTIVDKVGPFEAYRTFINNGYNVPKVVFENNLDVEKYLDFIPQLAKRKDKETNKSLWFIPYGKSYGEWTTNTSIIKNEVNRVNNIYNDLLVIRSKPASQQAILSKSRTKVEWVEINPKALTDYYKVYSDPRDIRKEQEDQGILSDYEQRASFSKKELNRKIKGFLKNIEYKSRDEASGNSVYTSTFEGVTLDIFRDLSSLEEDVIQQVTDFFIPKKRISLEDSSLFDELENFEQRGQDKLSPENREDFEAKKSIMLKNFPRVKEVIEDYNMPQSGVLEANGTIIKINPNLWTTDTIGHEFGHLLIDLIGGLENPLVKKARKQLIDSKIESDVKDRYSYLVEAKDDRIDKEIVAQAIGLETSKIFSKEKDRASWINLLNRILDRIKRILHIDHNASRSLARKVLSGPSINSPVNVDINFYEQKYSEKVKKEVNRKRKGKTEIEKLRDKTLAAIEKKYKIYSRIGIKDKIDKLEKTIKDIEQLDKDPVKALKLFQDFAVEQTQQVFDRYLVAKRFSDKAKRGEEGGKPFTVQELSRYKDYVSGFSLLKEFAELAESIETETAEKDPGIEDALNKEKLSEAIRQRDVIEKAYEKEGLDLTAEFLLRHSKHITVESKEKIELEYKALSPEEKDKISKEEYIEQELESIKEENIKRTKDRLSQELVKASKDVNLLTRWLDNISDSNDIVISSMVAAFVEADFKARDEFLNVQDEIYNKVTALENYYNNNPLKIKDLKNQYSFMLEKDSFGDYTQNIVAFYTSKLWEDHNNLKRKLESEGLSYDEVQNRMSEWRDHNMSLDFVNFKKALNKFYDSLLQNNIITKKELSNLYANDRLKKAQRKDVSEIVNDLASEKIQEWTHNTMPDFRTVATVYRNPQYQELVKMAGGDIKAKPHDQIAAVKANKNNDPRVDFYNYIVSQTKKAQLGIPYGHRLHNRLPSVIKSSGERIVEKQSPLTMLNHTFKSSLNVLADESDRGARILTNEAGDPVHFIPVYYTTNLYNYYANEFEDKLAQGKIKETFKTTEAKEEAKHRYAKKKADENQSYDIASIYARYFNSAISYQHKHAILPEMEMARFQLNKRETIKRDGKGNVVKSESGKTLSKEEKVSNLAQQFNDWYEALMFGIKEKDEGTLFGGKVDIAKAANLLNKYTAINLLGLNFIQGTANVVLGSTMQTIDAFGGDNYSKKDSIKANAFYGKNLPGILGDIATRKPKNIVSLLLRKFDILNEYQGVEFRKNSKFRQLLSTDTAFFTTHTGEHFMQSKVLLAMLNKLQAKDKDGNVLGSMLKQFSVKEGKLTLNENVANFTLNEQAVFEGRVRRVLSSLHGEYSEVGRIAIQRYALGRMGYMFRKFVVPGIKRRYQKKQINNALGEYVEGHYRTTGRFFSKLFKNLGNFQFTLMSSDWNSMTDREQANIRKTLAETAFLLTAIILSNVFISMKEDADDDEEWLWSFLAYQALRFKTELWFYGNPTEAMKILRSPAASMSVIENSIKLIGQLLPPDFEGFERYERGSWKGRPKIQKTTVNFVPGLKQIYRMKNVEDQISWFRQ